MKYNSRIINIASILVMYKMIIKKLLTKKSKLLLYPTTVMTGNFYSGKCLERKQNQGEIFKTVIIWREIRFYELFNELQFIRNLKITTHSKKVSAFIQQ